MKIDNTFESVARAWQANWKGPKSPRHADYVIRRLEADVFPVIGRKPIADVTAPQLLAMAKKIEARGALDIARRARQTVDEAHRAASRVKLERLLQQRADLAGCLDALLADAAAGRSYFKVYRQFKMYNDPRFNPELVKEARGA